MSKKIYLSEILFTKEKLELTFAGNKGEYVWLENVNKHLPDIIELNKTSEGKYTLATGYFDNFENVEFKLSVSNDFKKIDYYILPNIIIKNLTNYKINVDNNLLRISCNESKKQNSLKTESTDMKISSRKNRIEINNNPPLKVIVIGSCFSRSVFKSDNYFNPDYKRFFSVTYTAFHDSFISLMSNPCHDNSYLKTEDLLENEVFRYIEIEFKKDLFGFIDKINPDLIFIDNYIDATRPIICLEKDCYLTYNKYFSESIYKRKFSGLQVIYPGSSDHLELYRNSMVKFHKELKTRNLDSKVVLLGGRLSSEKIDREQNIRKIWIEKLSWIKKSNKNWDIVDSIFLEENKNSSFIDMRNTNWISDIASPLIGGASPSHYESEYYREIFNKLKEICFREV